MDRDAALAYLHAKFDQIEAAVNARDGSEVIRIIDQIEADGYPTVSKSLVRSLMDAGARRWADEIAGESGR